MKRSFIWQHKVPFQRRQRDSTSKAYVCRYAGYGKTFYRGSELNRHQRDKHGGQLNIAGSSDVEVRRMAEIDIVCSSAEYYIWGTTGAMPSDIQGELECIRVRRHLVNGKDWARHCKLLGLGDILWMARVVRHFVNSKGCATLCEWQWFSDIK